MDINDYHKPVETYDVSILLLSKKQELLFDGRVGNDDKGNLEITDDYKRKISDDKTELNRIVNSLGSDRELTKEFKMKLAECTVGYGPEKISPAIIPVIAAIGKYSFERYIDAQEERVLALKKRAQKSYTENIFIKSSQLTHADCALVVRHDSENRPGLIVLLEFNNPFANDKKKGEEKDKAKDAEKDKTKDGEKKAFIIEPTFVSASSTVVLTAKKENETSDYDWATDDIDAILMDDEQTNISEPPQIKVSIGIAIKEILDIDNSQRKLVPLGMGAVTVPKLILDDHQTEQACSKPCGKSDLIPYPLDKSSYISLSLSITETGYVGIDFDQKAAELKAIKEAFGSAISDSITKYYED